MSVELVRENLEVDIQPLVEEMQLQSGEVTQEQRLVEGLNRAYEEMEEGKYDSAIKRYQEAIMIGGKKYELTCLTNLMKCYVHKKSYGNAEEYYSILKAIYPHETSYNPEIRSITSTLDSIISTNRLSAEKLDKYAALRFGIEQKSGVIGGDLEVQLKLAALDFEFGFYGRAFDRALNVIEYERSLSGKGFQVFREMVDVLGPEDSYVKVARTNLVHLRHALQI